LHLSRFLFFVSFAVSAASVAYLGVAVRSVARFRFGRDSAAPARRAPPVTILKPVCGLDGDLEDNLRSFCRQDYPVYQVVFGVRDALDPAVPIVRRVIAAFPDGDLSLVVDSRISGANPKVSNLIAMSEHARHELLVVADSDMRVGPGYLSAVASAFDDPAVGAATCLYDGSAAGGLASILGTMFINDWFLPSVLVALESQELEFCFGATMAVKKGVLASIGGLDRLVTYLADDYMLGHLVSRKGLKVALAPVIVDNVVSERNLRSLVRHELRWARTVRTVRPVGFAFSFLTDAIPLSMLFLLVSRFSALGLGMFGLAAALRLVLHERVRARFHPAVADAPWLIPVRDFLTFGIRIASFLGHDVEWRDQDFVVDGGGRLAMKGGFPSERSS
jgi:ceramide glucosyltransferase